LAGWTGKKGRRKQCVIAVLHLPAALLTGLHFHTVDIIHLNWQIAQYNHILHHSGIALHQYRFLPQGTLWWMIVGRGDFNFSSLFVLDDPLEAFLGCLQRSNGTSPSVASRLRWVRGSHSKNIWIFLLGDLA
jgi:hypothetical protein